MASTLPHLPLPGGGGSAGLKIVRTWIREKILYKALKIEDNCTPPCASIRFGTCDSPKHTHPSSELAQKEWKLERKNEKRMGKMQKKYYGEVCQTKVECLAFVVPFGLITGAHT